MARHLLLGAAALFASHVSADRVGDPAFSVAAQLEEHAITTSGRFIIELSDSSAGGKFRKRDGTIDTDDIVASVEAATNTTAEPALTFNSGIFQGLSVQLASGKDTASTAAIEAIPGVAHAWPAALFTIPATVPGELELGDDGLPLWTPHDMTGVSKAHADGNFGQGVAVAIVDSGIDFNHPALGGGFGPGFKVAGGYDFVGDDYDPVLGTEPVPGGEPMDCGGHGTHVAGTVASTHEFNLGVAPNATLKAYKVFGCAGRASEDIVIAGLLRAFEEGPDIISASLGSIQGFPYTPSSIVVSRLQAAGVFVSVAAGNSGLDGGPFLTSDLANGFDVTSVGSVAHGKLAAYVAKASASDGTTRDIVYVPGEGHDWEFEGELGSHFYADTRGMEVCDYTKTHPGVRADRVLLLRRGDCDFITMDMPLNRRVTWAFFYNHEGAPLEEPFRDVFPESARGIAVISYEDGMWLLEQHEKGLDITYEFFNEGRAVSIPGGITRAGAADYYSSWGPTLDARIKPEICAPGSDILSTWPGGGFQVLSGTSMATPYISGIAALFFSSRGGRAAIGPGAAQLARERIISSGTPVTGDVLALLPEEKAPITKQGAGLVDVAKVLYYTTTVVPPLIHLNDTDNFVASHSIEIRNDGPSDVIYTVWHDPGTMAITKPNPSAWVGAFPEDVIGKGTTAEVQLSASNFTVAAGKSYTLTAEFTEPSGIDPVRLPVYGGQIVVSGNNGESVRVTYQGIQGSLFDADMWEMERGVPLFFRKMIIGVGNEAMEDGDRYPLTPVTETGGPIVYYVHHWATEELSLDYVSPDWQPSDWTYPPVAGENKWFGSLKATDRSYPMYFHIRNPGANQANIVGTYGDGRPIEEGEYRILARTLRNYGDRSNLDHWQWKISPRIEVYTPEPVPEPSVTSTSTSAPPTSTPTLGPAPPIATCGSSIPVHLTARIGLTDRIIPLVLYSEFLGVDITDSETPLEFTLTTEGFLKTRSPTNPHVELFAAAASIQDSLIYLYPENRITGVFSRVQFETKCGGGRLSATSDAKSKLYVCELEWEKHMPLRFTDVIPEGENCARVSLLSEELPLECEEPIIEVPPAI